MGATYGTGMGHHFRGELPDGANSGEEEKGRREEEKAWLQAMIPTSLGCEICQALKVLNFSWFHWTPHLGQKLPGPKLPKGMLPWLSSKRPPSFAERLP